jgi:tetratricopeptide (TPR) repeat protein
VRALIGPLTSHDPRGVLADRGRLDIRSFAPADADVLFDPRTESMETLWSRLPAGWRPDVLVWWTPEYSFVPEGIERCPVPSIAVVGDWNLGLWTTAPLLEAFDWVVTDTAGVRVLGPQLDVPVDRWPAFSFDTRVHRRRRDRPRDIDILFVGSMNFDVQVERAPWLGRLAGLSDRYRVHLTCSARGEEYAELLNRARIVWNRAIRGELNMRGYEAPACGGLLFMERENLEVRDVFVPGQSCVLYGDDNLESLLAYYLDRPELVDRLSEAGWRRVQSETHGHHLESLIERAAGLRTRPRGFGALPSWRRDYWLGLHALTIGDPGRSAAALAHFARAGRQSDEPGAIAAALGTVAVSTVFEGVADSAERAFGQAAQLFAVAERACPHDVVTRMNRAWVDRALGRGAEARSAWLAARETLRAGAGVRLDRMPLPFAFDRLRTEWEGVAVDGDADRRAEGFRRLLLARVTAELAGLDSEAERARGWWAESHEAWPDIAANRRRLAEALAAGGDRADAARALAEVLTLNPFDWTARFAAVQLAAVDEDVDRLAALVHQAQQLARSSPEARRALDALDPSHVLEHALEAVGGRA